MCAGSKPATFRVCRAQLSRCRNHIESVWKKLQPLSFKYWPHVALLSWNSTHSVVTNNSAVSKCLELLVTRERSRAWVISKAFPEMAEDQWCFKDAGEFRTWRLKHRVTLDVGGWKPWKLKYTLKRNTSPKKMSAEIRQGGGTGHWGGVGWSLGTSEFHLFRYWYQTTSKPTDFKRQ